MTDVSAPARVNAPLRRVFPTRADVREAVARIPATLPRWDGQEGPRFRLELSPGTIRITSTDLARKNRAENLREASRLRHDADMLLHEARSPGRRGPITGWSTKSRARMAYRLATIDYTPLFAGGARPAMVTLTMPGEWVHLVPSADLFKKRVNKWRARYEQSWGGYVGGVWKLEFQRRGAPHLHIIMTPPTGRATARLSMDDVDHLRQCWVGGDGCDELVHDAVTPAAAAHVQFCDGCKNNSHWGLFEFRDWSRRVWATVVGAEGEERRRHERAGCSVDFAELDNYADPTRIGAYFAKHGTWAAKEYQNHVPAAWRASGGVNVRFWGYWVVEPVIESVEIHEALIMHIVRHLRKLADRTAVRRVVVQSFCREVVGFIPEPGGVAVPVVKHVAKRRRPVRRRVRRFRRPLGFWAVSGAVELTADIRRIISARAWLDDGVDFFGAAPDHAPRAGLVLHDDFHSSGAFVADEFGGSEFGHALGGGVGSEWAGEPLSPVGAGACGDVGLDSGAVLSLFAVPA